jgi:hypothetical protein
MVISGLTLLSLRFVAIVVMSNIFYFFFTVDSGEIKGIFNENVGKLSNSCLDILDCVEWVKRDKVFLFLIFLCSREVSLGK